MRTLVRLSALILLLSAAAPVQAACIDYGEYFSWASLTATGAGAQAVAIRGDLVCVGGEGPGLGILSIADPAAPIPLATLPTPGRVADIVLTEQFAALSIVLDTGWPGHSALWLLDLSEPAAPVLIGSLEVDGVCGKLALKGEYAYLLWSSPLGALLEIVDLSDPAHPSLAGSSDLPTGSGELIVSGDRLHCTYSNDMGYGGYGIYDLADPLHPEALGGLSLGAWAGALAVAGQHAFVSCDLGFVAIDGADPSAPTLVGTAPYFDHVGANTVVLAGERAYVVANELTVLDIADPSALEILFSEGTAGGAYDADLSGDRLCIAQGASGLLAIGIGNGQPAPPLSVPVADTCYGVAERNGLVYFTGSGGSFAVADAGDPAQPQLLGSLALDADGGAIVLGDDLALVMMTRGLRIVDIAQPASPQLLGGLEVSDLCFSLALAGDTAYLAGDGVGILVIDIADPVSPQIVNTIAPGQSILDLEVAAGRLYGLDFWEDLQIFDLADPAQPTLIGQFPLPIGYRCNVQVEGDLAYVLCGPDGLFILDVSDPAQPELATVLDYGSVWSVDVTGTRMALGAGGGTLLLLELTNPLAPRLLGNAVVAGLHDVAIGEGAIFCAAGAPTGLVVLAHDCYPTAVPTPAPEALALQAWPNPFNPQVTLKFSLPAPSAVTLGIYDAAGRFVATLASGHFEAGGHSRVWEGRDAEGKPVASGIYLARLQAGSAQGTWKLVLLR